MTVVYSLRSSEVRGFFFLLTHLHRHRCPVGFFSPHHSAMLVLVPVAERAHRRGNLFWICKRYIVLMTSASIEVGIRPHLEVRSDALIQVF